jgi:hypothetical protein
VIEISADMSTNEANILQQQLRTRKVAFSFTVDFTLNARFTSSETTGNFKSITVRDTNSVQQLVGSGRVPRQRQRLRAATRNGRFWVSTEVVTDLRRACEV